MPSEITARLVRHPASGATYILVTLADTTTLLLSVEEATALRDALAEALT